MTKNYLDINITIHFHRVMMFKCGIENIYREWKKKITSREFLFCMHRSFSYNQPLCKCVTPGLNPPPSQKWLPDCATNVVVND